MFDLRFPLIAHGRVCPACGGGAKGGEVCEAAQEKMGRQC